MTFLSPLALLALVAALVPPLLHLFQRRHPPDLEFPAVRYLQQTEREAQRRIRLEHLLLMLLRVAAVVLIVLAAARPVVPRGIGGFHEPTAVAIVLDNSLSSGAVAGGSRVFDLLAERSRETLAEAQSGDALWLMGADGIARRGSAAELRALVGAMKPEARRLDLVSAVRTAQRLVTTSGYARAEVHLLSDLQRTAIGIDRAAQLGGVGATPTTPTIPTIPTTPTASPTIPLLSFHPSGDPPPNAGIAEARPQPSLWLAGTGAVAVRVEGAPVPERPSQASLVLEGRPGGRALARSGGAMTLAAPRTLPGWRTGAVELAPDELRGDDRRPFAVRVVPPASVSAAAESSLGHFVTEALAVLHEAGQIRLGARGEVTIGTGIAGGGAGAVVIVPPADQVELGTLNRELVAAGVPWRFGVRVEREDTLASAQVPELSGARVRSRLRLEPAGLDSAGGEVLARAGTEPWLVRYGRVVLLGSRLVPEETSLPVSGGFVPFLSALLNRVARGESGVIEATSGDPIQLPGRATALGINRDSLQPVEGGAVISAPVEPGSYAVLGGRDTLAMLVVGPDARESDLTRAGAGELRRRLPGLQVNVTDDSREYAARRFRGAGRSELTGWLLVLALVVLAAEAMLAAGGVRRSA